MNIKNRLFMSAGISIILVVILLSLVLVTSGRIAEGSKKHELLDNVHRGVAELDILAYDYLLHREERMEQQWHSKYNSLAEILDEAAKEELTSIRTDYASLGDLFTKITERSQKTQKLIQEGASQEKIDAAIALEERLVAYLLITSHSIFTSVFILTEGAQAEVKAFQRLSTILTLALMIILAITVTTSSLLVARSISKPLNELIKGIEIISEGAFDHKIVVGTKDEMGQLASSFNKMTKDLRQITVSRNELEKEITERQRAEEELKKHRDHLEDSVKERTAELETEITEHKLAEKELAEHREHLEELVKERTAELEKKNAKLREFNKLFLGREIRIKELKEKVKELESRLKKNRGK